MLKNDVNLLQIKTKNQESNINLLKNEIEDLNDNHANKIDQIKKEQINNLRLMNHYKGITLFIKKY